MALPADLSPRTQAEEPACQCQVRFVDHPAVDGDRPCVRVSGKRLDDRARPGEFFIADRKSLVDDRDLRRMDRHLCGKAGSPRGSALGGEPGLILEIGTDRIDRDDLGGCRSQQA